jgi:hypothetical protein
MKAGVVFFIDVLLHSPRSSRLLPPYWPVLIAAAVFLCLYHELVASIVDII